MHEVMLAMAAMLSDGGAVFGLRLKCSLVCRKTIKFIKFQSTLTEVFHTVHDYICLNSSVAAIASTDLNFNDKFDIDMADPTCPMTFGMLNSMGIKAVQFVCKGKASENMEEGGTGENIKQVVTTSAFEVMMLSSKTRCFPSLKSSR